MPKSNRPIGSLACACTWERITDCAGVRPSTEPLLSPPAGSILSAGGSFGTSARPAGSKAPKAIRGLGTPDAAIRSSATAAISAAPANLPVPNDPPKTPGNPTANLLFAIEALLLAQPPPFPDKAASFASSNVWAAGTGALALADTFFFGRLALGDTALLVDREPPLPLPRPRPPPLPCIAFACGPRPGPARGDADLPAMSAFRTLELRVALFPGRSLDPDPPSLSGTPLPLAAGLLPLLGPLPPPLPLPPETCLDFDFDLVLEAPASRAEAAVA